MTNSVLTFSAAILAGGQSSRMGRDKALIPLPPDGSPMIEVVLDRLREIAEDTFFVVNDDRLARFGVRAVPDAYPGTGTLGGIHAALLGAKHGHCLVVACDMPFLSLDLLRHMAAVDQTYDVLIPMTSGVSKQSKSGVIFQTLHAIYAKTCIAPIERRLVSGDNRVISFFDDVQVRTISEEECRNFDPELRSFLNLNTPEALTRAVASFEAMEPEDMSQR